MRTYQILGVSARIRGAKAELDELGESTDDIAEGFSKYREEIEALSGVDVMKDENTYKDMYTIFVELASVWEDMSDISQARVAEILGGTRNTSGVMSTIVNIKDAIGAYEGAMNSAGAATKANTIYMDTAKAKFGELKASFQELSQDVLDSWLVKKFIDYLRMIVEGVDSFIDKMGSLQTVIATFSGVKIIKAFKDIHNSATNFKSEEGGSSNGSYFSRFSTEFSKTYPMISSFSKHIKDASAEGNNAFTSLAKGAKNFLVDEMSNVCHSAKDGVLELSKNIKNASKEGNGAFSSLAKGVGKSGGVIKSFVSSVTRVAPTILGAASLAFIAYQAYQKNQEELINSGNEAANALEQTKSSLDDYKNRIIELRGQLASGTLSEREAYQAKSELLSIQESLVKSYGDQVAGIDLVNGALNEEIALLDKVSRYKANQFLSDNADSIKKSKKQMEKERSYYLGSYNVIDGGETSKAIDEAMKLLKSKYKDALDISEGERGEVHITVKADAADAKAVLEDFQTDVGNITNKFGENDVLKDLNASAKAALNDADKILTDYQAIYDQAKIAEIAVDTKLYSINVDEKKTALEWMNEYTKAVEEYNAALASGDSEKITVAQKKFEAIDKSVQSLIKGGMKEYSDVFEGIGDKLNTASINARKFKNAIKGVGVDGNEDGVDTTVKKYSDAYNNLANEQKKIEELGLGEFGNAFDTSGRSFVQKKFGNVDMDKRVIIEWSDELKNTYKDALASWEYNPEVGSIDTVFGGSERFGESSTLEHGVEVAFTPIMNVDGEAEILDKTTVKSYIEKLIGEATADGDFSEEELIDLDKQGRKIGDTMVRGIIAAADEGLNYEGNQNRAEVVGKLMHFSGEYGAIALAYKDIDAAAKEAGISTEEFIASFQKTSKTTNKINKAAKALKKLGLSDKDFIGAFETDGSQKGEANIKKLVNAAQKLGIISDTSSASLQSLANILIELGVISGIPVDHFDTLGTKIQNTTTEAKKFVNEIATVQGILSGQKSGMSIDIEVYNSEELDGYRDALEYTNGTMQLNIEKTRELAKAKAEEKLATIAQNKAESQAKYIENARQIEKYRQRIRDANFEKGQTAESVQTAIDALRKENVAIAEMCDQYDILSLNIEDAMGAYQHWLNAQNATDYGDMANDAVSAIQQIRDAYDANSDTYRQFGSRKFGAAVEFIVPDSIDSNDRSAIESYMASITDYLKFGENGTVDSLNIDKFLQESVNAGLMSFSEDEGFKILGGIKMADFAEGLNMSSGLVQAFFDEMQLYDGKFNWGDEAVVSMGDLVVKANEAAEALRKMDGNKHLKLKLDYSDIKDTEGQLKCLDDTIAEMEEYKTKPGIDASEIEYANTIIQYCLEQKNLLTQPDVLRVDVSQVDGDLGQAIALLQEFHETQSQFEIQARLGVDTTLTKEKMDSLLAEIQGLSPKVKADLEIDSTSADTVKEFINKLTANRMVKIGVSADAISGYDKKTEKVKVIYDPDEDLLPKSFEPINRDVKYKPKGHEDLPEEFDPITRYVNYVAQGDTSGANDKSKDKSKGKSKDKKGGSGKHQVNGTAHASGTARASGDWGTAPGGKTLVGELGREIVVNPRSGKWYTVGDSGAEFVDIPAGAIVFNHLQTEDLLANGYVTGRASALMNGTALVSGTAMVTGGFNPPEPSGIITGRLPSSNSGGGYKGNKNSSSNTSNGTDDFKETIDFIEIAIARIVEAINRLKIVADSAFKTLSKRNNAVAAEISKVTYQIDLQYKAYERYLAEANSVGLSESWARMVRNGAIDIATIEDKDLAEKIKKYKDFYDKAVKAKDAIADLHEEIAKLYKNKFDNIANDFENRLDLLEHLTKTYDAGIEELEEKGYLASTKYYDALKSVESQNIAIMQEELSSLTASMAEAVNSGKIEENSEAWYDMQKEINSVKEAIQESQIELVKFDNTIREIKWERFDYLQEQISNITEEADFMIDLMESSKLFSDKGELTNEGMATLGIHGQNYNVYMAQSDKYANELKQINAEIANDPNNLKLLERRQELIEAQRDAILAAENEKEAIKDLVEEGIKLELDALQDLIDRYLDAMDTAKDLYDYQKQIKEQTSEIASLQKQLAAYSGDNSEETKATIQKIEVDLAKAQENLEETQYERYISEQKKILDTLYSEYETILNSRLDNIDALMSETIDTINANASIIQETLIAQSDKAGYTISDAITSIWSNEGGATSVITKYGEQFNAALTSVNNVLNAISIKVAKMAGESDVEAEKDISTTKPNTSPLSPTRPDDSNSPSKKPSSTNSVSRSDKEYYGVALAISNGGYGWGAGTTRMNKLKSKGFDAAKVQAIVNQMFRDGYVRNGSWVGRYYGIRDLSPYNFNRYKNGGLVDYTGLAQLDGTPSNPELVLNAKDTSNFIALKDAIKDISDGNSPLAKLFDEGAAAQILERLSHIDAPKNTYHAGIGDVSYYVNIPIEHVQDYNDFMNQMKNDGKFEKLVRSMTVDRLSGLSKLSKNKYQW